MSRDTTGGDWTRNRAVAVAGGLALLAGLAGLGLGLSLGAGKNRELTDLNQRLAALDQELKQANLQEAQARALAENRLAQVKKSNEILGSIFSELDPRAAEREGRPLRAIQGEKLDQAAAMLDGDLAGDPLTAARLKTTLARSLLGQGYADRAIGLLEQVRQTRTELKVPEDAEGLEAASLLAEAYRAGGQPDKALAIHERTLAARRETSGPDHPDTLAQMNGLAQSYRDAGQPEKALPLLEQTLEAMRKKLGAEHPETLRAMNDLAEAYRTTGKPDQALPLLERALELRRKILGPDHPDTLSSMSNLALGYRDVGEFDKALPLFEQTLALNNSSLGADHPQTLICMNGLAACYVAAGQLDKALPLFEQAVGKLREKLGPDHPETLKSAANLAHVQSLLGESLAGQAKSLQTTDAAAAEAKFAEAETLLLNGYQGLKQGNAGIPEEVRATRLSEALNRLVAFYAARGKPDEAARWRRELEAAGPI